MGIDRDKILNRFDELEKKFKALPRERNDGGYGYHYDGFDWLSWATSAQHLTISVFGENSVHARGINKAVEECKGYDYECQLVFAVFCSANDDFKGGYLSNVEKSISGEIFGDFVGMARAALSEGHKNVAAV